MTVRLVAGDPQSVVFRFFDGNGLDLTEDQQRKIERLYSREDFRRVFASEIGDIGYPPRALEQYTAALEETVDVGAVADHGFKLVVDYGFGSTSFVMPQVLAKLGADVLGVNPYAATSGAMEFDRTTHAELVASLVRASGAKIGAVIDPDGEHLTVIDDEGRVLDDVTTLMAFVTLVSGHLIGDQVALPVNVSRVVEDLVAAGRRAGALHEDLHPGPDGRGHGAGRGVRGQHRRWLHPPGLPARLRRGRLAGEAARAAGRRGHHALRGGRQPARGCTWPTRWSSRRGSRRAS